MKESSRILIADDDIAFLKSTSRMLEEEGYGCDCAEDAAATENMLRSARHDLLISDIRMPGNDRLEFVRALPRIARSVPVILVTAHPSVETALESLELPVVAYMVKPVDGNKLLEHVRVGIRLARLHSDVMVTRRQMAQYSQALNEIELALGKPRPAAIQLSARAMADVTLARTVDSLRFLKRMIDLLTQGSSTEACRLENCPHADALSSGIRGAIKVIDKTRRAFKSKDLAELRVTLERLVAKTA